MSTCTLEKPAPPSKVNRELLMRLQNLILQKAADLEGEKYDKSQFHVIVEEPGIRLELHAVDEMIFPLPSDVTGITLVYRSLVWELDGPFSMQINFASRPGSGYGERVDSGARCDIRFTGHFPDEQVNGIWAKVLHEMGRYPHPTFVRKRSEAVATLSFGFACIGVFFGLLSVGLACQQRERSKLIFGCALLVTGCVVLMYLYFARSIPHSLFDTLRADAAVDRTKWFSRLTIGWLIFGGALMAAVKWLFWGPWPF